MRPVGVGLMSRGPTGVDGLTITAGKLALAHELPHHLLGQEFGALVMADHVREAARRRFIGRAAVVVPAQRGDAAGIDDARDAGLRAPPPSRAACPRHWRRTSAPDRAPRAGNPPRRDRPRRSRRGRRQRLGIVERARAGHRHRGPRYCARSLDGRSSTRTLRPWASSARATAEPTKPDAPVTSTGWSEAAMATDSGFSRKRPGTRRPARGCR